MKALLMFCWMMITAMVASAFASDTIPPKRGSYLYFEHPAIEDNSMLIEEAFNQERGKMQYISNFIFHRDGFSFAYCHEIPIGDHFHQFSYNLAYSFLKTTSATGSAHGVGDLLLNYRPLIGGKQHWILLIPRFSLVVPTGKSDNNLGFGGWGGQFNLAMTKRISRNLTTHINSGFTFISKADFYADQDTGESAKKYEKDLWTGQFGLSVIFAAKKNFHMMLESFLDTEESARNDASFVKNQRLTINPGFRFALNVGKIQIVPGMGIPIEMSDGNDVSTGAFFYLSLETSR
jgi:hypothetical protein